MWKGFIALSLLVATSCETIAPEEHQYPIQCKGTNEVKYCEGINPRGLDCECMKINLGEYSGYRVA